MKIKPGGLAVLIVLVAVGIIFAAKFLGAGDGTSKGVPRLSGKSVEQQGN
jgi:hypothetical protein